MSASLPVPGRGWQPARGEAFTSWPVPRSDGASSHRHRNCPVHVNSGHTDCSGTQHLHPAQRATSPIRRASFRHARSIVSPFIVHIPSIFPSRQTSGTRAPSPGTVGTGGRPRDRRGDECGWKPGKHAGSHRPACRRPKRTARCARPSRGRAVKSAARSGRPAGAMPKTGWPFRPCRDCPCRDCPCRDRHCRRQVSSCRLSHAASRDPGASGVSVGRCCNDAVDILPVTAPVGSEPAGGRVVRCAGGMPERTGRIHCESVPRPISEARGMSVISRTIGSPSPATRGPGSWSVSP